LHRNHVVDGNPGDNDEVTYDVGVDDRNGKPCANNVVVIGGGTGKGKGGGFGGGKKGGGKKGGYGGKGGGGFGGGFGGGGGCGGGFGGGMGENRAISEQGCSGTIKYFNDTKGFGFINHHDGTSLFLHRNHVVDGNPGDNDEVTYDVGVDDRNGKPCANNVVVIGGGTGKGKGGGFGGGKKGGGKKGGYGGKGGGGFGGGGFGGGGFGGDFGGGFPGGPM